MLFKDRTAAGKLLAARLTTYADRSDVIILALPRGGVPVAFEVAKALNAPLDLCLVRKLGVPGQEELAMGALAKVPGTDFTDDGVRVLNQAVVRSRQLFEAVLYKATIREQRELERRERLYRGDRPAPNLRHHTVILVDDGLATGATMRAAVLAVKQQRPTQTIVAVPVASPETYAEFGEIADQVVCVDTPTHFYSVGLWYEDFSQTTDETVQELLKQTDQHSTMMP